MGAWKEKFQKKKKKRGINQYRGPKDVVIK